MNRIMFSVVHLVVLPVELIRWWWVDRPRELEELRLLQEVEAKQAQLQALIEQEQQIDKQLQALVARIEVLKQVLNSDNN